MFSDSPALVGFALFASTLAIIAVHGIESFHIGTSPRAEIAAVAASEKLPSKLQVLKGGLR